jgi:hypothetical protein
MPIASMNDSTPRVCHLHIWVLLMPDTKEIIPHIEFRVDPQVSHAQSLEGSYK